MVLQIRLNRKLPTHNEKMLDLLVGAPSIISDSRRGYQACPLLLLQEIPYVPTAISCLLQFNILLFRSDPVRWLNLFSVAVIKLHDLDDL